jgi:ribosomal protein L12E/L44/L45/RPP1/RPP2
VIKSVVLVSVGFGVGYMTAVSQHEEIRIAARTFIQFLEDVALQEEIRRKEEADAKAGAVDATAEEVPEDEASDEQDDEPPTAA